MLPSSNIKYLIFILNFLDNLVQFNIIIGSVKSSGVINGCLKMGVIDLPTITPIMFTSLNR